MSAETVVRRMIQEEREKKLSLADAYDRVIAILQADVREVAEQRDALQAKLVAEKRSDEYIKFRLDAFAIQVEMVTGLLSMAIQFKYQKME